MTERRPVSSFETPPIRQVSADERINLKKSALLEKIYLRAIEVKNQLLANKIKPDALITVVLEPWPDDAIETKGCWIITNHSSTHYKLGNDSIQHSIPYTFSTGYALKDTGEIIEYETDEDIRNNPRLLHVPGKQLGEIITESPFDPQEYLDNGIMQGLDVLNERATFSTIK